MKTYKYQIQHGEIYFVRANTKEDAIKVLVEDYGVHFYEGYDEFLKEIDLTLGVCVEVTDEEFILQSYQAGELGQTKYIYGETKLPCRLPDLI